MLRCCRRPVAVTSVASAQVRADRSSATVSTPPLWRRRELLSVSPPRHGRFFSTATAATQNPVAIVSRRAYNMQQQKLKDLATSGGGSGGSASKPKGPSTSSQAKSTDELPWPRNFVIAGYTFTAIAVPYTLAWLFSTNATLRGWIIGEHVESTGDKEVWNSNTPVAVAASTKMQILNRLRQHFGVVDWESLSEPEAVDITYPPLSGSKERITTILPHRFVDEPTVRIRRQQANIATRHCDEILVRFHSPTSTSYSNAEDKEYLVSLKATTPARHETIARAAAAAATKTNDERPLGPLVAVDFPIVRDKDSSGSSINEHTDATEDLTISLQESVPWQESSHNTIPVVQETTLHTPRPSSISIYSPWHHHVSTATASAQQQESSSRKHAGGTTSSSTSNSSKTVMTDTEWNLARINFELERLQAELKSQGSSRSIDDIQAEVRQLQAERRQYQWKRWTSW
jgi:hypothetical protein